MQTFLQRDPQSEVSKGTESPWLPSKCLGFFESTDTSCMMRVSRVAPSSERLILPSTVPASNSSGASRCRQGAACFCLYLYRCLYINARGASSTALVFIFTLTTWTGFSLLVWTLYWYGRSTGLDALLDWTLCWTGPSTGRDPLIGPGC